MTRSLVKPYTASYRNTLNILCLSSSLFFSSSAIACEGKQHIQLLNPVKIDTELRAELQAMKPLKVVAVNAPPLARYDENISVNSSEDLANYRVGFIEGVSLQPILESIVPLGQLHPYNQTTSDGLFQAVQNGEIDVAVFNQQIFMEKRYNQEYLNLEVIHTLTDYRRDYSYYFSQQPEHERLVEAFNLYIAAIDTSATITMHKRGERNFFERYVTQRNQRTGQSISLLLLDVDHFKNVNDHYGHAVGDDYLRAIATTLENSVFRSTDLVARYGGEEFACLLTDTSPEDALKVAKRISHEIAKLSLPNASVSPPYLTLSIGLATIINGDPGVKEIFSQADAQLYIAKNTGRDQIRNTIIEE